MKNIIWLLLFFCIENSLFAQQQLPSISVTSSNQRVVVSWLNDYKTPVENILIQRSFDSIKNFRTIGSVLNPLNLENGYPDQHPPYDRMYYRVFISFKNGNYITGPSARYHPELVENDSTDIQTDSMLTFDETPSLFIFKNKTLPFYSYYSSIYNPTDSIIQKDSLSQVRILETPTVTPEIKFVEKQVPINKTPAIRSAYPSISVYANSNQTVVLDFRSLKHENVSIHFSNEKNDNIFVIDPIPEPLLYLERYNFGQSGWYYFEIFEQGKLVEKSKVLIGRDKGIPGKK
jgi:hypothetical protein